MRRTNRQSGNKYMRYLSARGPTPRHLIFTASFLAFYPVAGYAPYNPSKAALRSMSDTLSQEMNLYAAAHPDQPPVKVHTVFPARVGNQSIHVNIRLCGLN
ncbi:hypothetical protein F5883DRAFT_647119 [Diaporthe sp. PMI_573]|nr:hypothetical protein F5883DRAFT_647119 [Diaporthaceae sp. PMI_573]